jgi:HSP20 family molecular chaperone IbpA
MKHHAIHLTEHRFKRVNTHSKNEPIIPPHWTEETDDTYSVGFDLLGCKQEQVQFLINKEERHLSVTAQLEGSDSDLEFFWSFQLPVSADLEKAAVTSRNGVYFLTFPRIQI